MLRTMIDNVIANQRSTVAGIFNYSILNEMRSNLWMNRAIWNVKNCPWNTFSSCPIWTSWNWFTLNFKSILHWSTRSMVIWDSPQCYNSITKAHKSAQWARLPNKFFVCRAARAVKNLITSIYLTEHFFGKWPEGEKRGLIVQPAYFTC